MLLKIYKFYKANSNTYIEYLYPLNNDVISLENSIIFSWIADDPISII
ncbi:hypothetical protein JCM30566_11140 [Marinitoga arctica]